MLRSAARRLVLDLIGVQGPILVVHIPSPSSLIHGIKQRKLNGKAVGGHSYSPFSRPLGLSSTNLLFPRHIVALLILCSAMLPTQ